MRPPGSDITVPEFPAEVEWLGAPFVRMSTLLGRSVSLVWFWDYCSLNSLRALPYLEEWHRRYVERGLRVIAVHSPQFEFARESGTVAKAVERLGVPFPVGLDQSYEIWRLYGNEVWPALYLWDRRGILRYHHFGEGRYAETEKAIQELLREIDPELRLPAPMEPLRDTDHPGALVRPPTPHQYLEEDRSGRPLGPGDELSVRYQGATAAGVLDGHGEVAVELDGAPLRTIRLDGPGLYELFDSPGHEEHELRLRFRHPARAYAFSFAAGPA